LIFPVTDGEAQDLAFAGQVDADDGENRHLMTLTFIDDTEIGAIGKDILIMRRQRSFAPSGIFRF
jgi:hypothetical protein